MYDKHDSELQQQHALTSPTLLSTTVHHPKPSADLLQ